MLANASSWWCRAAALSGQRSSRCPPPPCRLWQAHLPDATGEGGAEEQLHPPTRLSLLTPARTLRGHTESVTCMQILRGGTGARYGVAQGRGRAELTQLG